MAKIDWDLGPYRRDLANLDAKLRGTLIRKAAREMVKPIQATMKTTVPVAKKEYGPGGTTKKSIGNKVKLYGGKRRSFAGLHGVDRAVVIVGPRTKWSRMLQKKFRFIGKKGAKGVRKFKSTQPQKVQPSRTVGPIEKRTKFVARAAKQARQRAIAAATRVLREGLRTARGARR